MLLKTYIKKKNIINSRINERDHNISCSGSDGKAFVIMSESTRVHKQPADSSLLDTAIITQEMTSTAL